MTTNNLFEIRFEAPSEVLSFRDGDLSHNGVFISDTRDVPPLTPVQVRFHLVDLPPLDVDGQLVPSGHSGTGYVTMTGGDALDALHAAVELVSARDMETVDTTPHEESTEDQNSIEDGGNPDEGWGVHASDDADAMDEEESDAAAGDESVPGRVKPVPAWQLIDTTSELPIAHQVRELSLKDKMRLARHATRPVRQLLIRDVDKSLHIQVIKNPKVTDQEIVEYSAIASISPLALRWLGDQRRHLRNVQIVQNLVLNPATPPDLAKKLMSRMNKKQLMRVMRSGRVKEAIRRTARKKLMDAGEL